jgi:seryl-tRNA synthetase
MNDKNTLKARLKALQDGRNRLAADIAKGRVQDRKAAIKHGENITADIKRLKKKLKGMK